MLPPQITKYTQDQISSFFDTWLQQRANQDGLPGFVLAIRQNGSMIYNQQFQAENLTMPLNTFSTFNIGSQAKLLTATLILQAVERELLSFDSTAVQFVPWLAHHPDPRVRLITIEQLLWHGSGLIRDGLDADYWQLMKPFPSRTDLRDAILGSPLVMRGGYKLKYSNLGYALLGEVLREVTGMEYATLIREHIAKPLELRSLTASLTVRTKKHVAPGYTERIGGTYRPIASAIDTNAFASVVGCYATAEDMTRLVDEIVNGDILLSPAMRRKLITGGRTHWMPESQRGSDYGLGVMSLAVAGQTIIGHSGTLLAHRSATYTDPSTGTTVAIMATSKQVPVNQILTGIFEALDYLTRELPRKPTPNDRFTITLQNLLGAQHFIGLKDRVVKVLIDDWYPFDQIDEMEVIDKTTLRYTQAHDFNSSGELVHYNFSQGDIISVRSAGLTMWPKDTFNTWLFQNM